MNTTAQIIPKDQWQQYFTDLSKPYQGWSVTIEDLAGELGDQRSVDGLPFQGISYEAKGGSQAGDILIETGDAGTPFETHLIHRPRAVRVSTLHAGGELDMEIEDEEGIARLISLRPHAELPPP